MGTSISVLGRQVSPSVGFAVLRLTPVYNNPLQFNIVYNITDSTIVGLRLFNINGNGTSTDYAGTGFRAITLSTASLLSTITAVTGYDSLGANVGTPTSISIQDISPTLDFIAVTATYSETSPRILRLPPVTAHKRPIFIKLGRNTSAISDGVWIITRGDSFIDSSSRTSEVVGGTTYNHSGAVFIGGRASSFNVNYPCITLFSDGSNWYVANYYPMSITSGESQFFLSALSDANPDPAKLATANASGVNIFKNNVPARQSGNNMVLLPTPTSPSICMIVYGGNQGTRVTGNALIIKDTRGGSWIDGFSANNPCILTNGDDTGGNAKSTGIVLFYDTTGAGKWYVIGWYYPYRWTWGNSSTTPTGYGDIQGYHAMKDLATPAGQERKICVTPDIVGARFYILPTSTATNPQVIIFKARNITVVPGATDGREDVRGLRYSTQNSSTINNNRINTNTISIKYGSTDSNHATSKYSCVWFVSEQVTGESFLRYYPVIAYVPNP